MSLISVKNLTRYYGKNCAVNNVSFELKAGDILGFLGPNGAGKSTTMQMLSGNLAPSEGSIHINGHDLLEQPKLAKAAVGYLPETPPVYKELTVDEYLAYCAKLHHIQNNSIGDTVNVAKKQCGLADTGRRLIGNLSKGYQQRVGIAQAILHTPEVIILDEPTIGLDPNQIREIRDLIVKLGEDHAIILCTHILPEVQAVCNRVQIIDKGAFVYQSDMEELLDRRVTGSYEIHLLRAPEINELNSIPSIRNAERIRDNLFLVHTTGSAEELVRASVENDWGLDRLVPHQRTLEQVFVDLTLGEAEIESVGEAHQL